MSKRVYKIIGVTKMHKSRLWHKKGVNVNRFIAVKRLELMQTLMKTGMHARGREKGDLETQVAP
jgi:hypothetical protein